MITQAIPTKYIGLLESPYPLRIALKELYPQTNTFPHAQTATYTMVYVKDSSGVFSNVSRGFSKTSIRPVRRMATRKKTHNVVAIHCFIRLKSFMPVYFPIKMVLPSVRPDTRLVIIWVTCVPVETAATLCALQYFPTTNKSTAPYRDCRTFAIRKGTAKKINVVTMFPSVRLFLFISSISFI